MKRWIHASSLQDYINSLPEVYGYKILFEDEITIQLEAPDINDLIASKQYDPFPGETQYVQDLKDILQNEFGFVLVPDIKGRIEDVSSTNDGLSVYFNTIYDLSKINNIRKIYGLPEFFKGINIGILCGVETQISDHPLTTGRNTSNQAETENDYAKRQVEYTRKNNPSVSFVVTNQQNIYLNKYNLYTFYNDELSAFKLNLASCIRQWCEKVEDEIEEGRWKGEILV